MELVKNRREGRATGEAGAAGMDVDEGDYEERMRKGKMKQQDMAGAIKMDRQNLRLAELQLLFRVCNKFPVQHAGDPMQLY